MRFALSRIIFCILHWVMIAWVLLCPSWRKVLAQWVWAANLTDTFLEGRWELSGWSPSYPELLAVPHWEQTFCARCGVYAELVLSFWESGIWVRGGLQDQHRRKSTDTGSLMSSMDRQHFTCFSQHFFCGSPIGLCEFPRGKAPGSWQLTCSGYCPLYFSLCRLALGPFTGIGLRPRYSNLLTPPSELLWGPQIRTC